MQTAYPLPLTKFNELVPDLANRLRFCFQADDGTIYWYEGTRKLLFEVMQYAIGADILAESSQEKKSM